MGAVLFKVEDPRDNLAKATRDELWDYVKAVGLMSDMMNFMKGQTFDIERGWIVRNGPATQATITKLDMENYLRGRGHISMAVAVRAAGRPTGEFTGNSVVAEVRTEQPKEPVAIDDLSITELRSQCKAKGIKLARTDNKNTMREKLKAA